MARKTTAWVYWGGLSTLVAISVTLAVGWWLDHRTQSVEMDTLRSQITILSSQPSVEALRAENSDLAQFIDEAYALLNEKGFHIKLDVEVDRNGRYRLRADSVILMGQLEAKLRELDE